MVYNKIDKIDAERLQILKDRYGTDNCVWISTYTKEGLDDVKKILAAKLVS